MMYDDWCIRLLYLSLQLLDFQDDECVEYRILQSKNDTASGLTTHKCVVYDANINCLPAVVQ